MWEKIKDIYTRDTLLTVLLIISLTITCFLILSTVSSVGKYDEKMAEYTDENGEFIEGKGIGTDDYENLLGVRVFHSGLMLVVTLFTILNCVMVTGVWFNRRNMEFAVRKAFGSTNMMIVKPVLLELFVMTVTALVLAVVLYFIGSLLGLNSFGIHGSALKNIVLIPAGCIAVDLISVGMNMSKISRLTPVELINSGRV